MRPTHREGPPPGLPPRHALRDLQAARGTTLTGRRTGVRLLALGIALLGLGLDQLVKAACVAFLEPGVPVPLVGSLLQLNLIRNPGAAFGMGAEATIVFTVFAIVATLACLGYALPRITRVWHGVVLGMLLAGITGNLVDRITQPPSVLHGHVVDMFQLRGFAIFNVADMFITCAAVVLIGFSFLGDRRTSEEAEAKETADA
ncbi:MAG: signal peptidase II [Arachnia sp.]